MRRFTVTAAVVAALIAVMGCSGSISTRMSGPIEATGPIGLWPTAPALTGSPPVGYWECVNTFDVEEIRASNSAHAPRQHDCRGFDGDRAIEYKADGTGYDLAQYRRGQ